MSPLASLLAQVQVDTGLTNDHSPPNYRKCDQIVPMDRAQTYGNIQTVAGPAVNSNVTTMNFTLNGFHSHLIKPRVS